MLVRNVLHVPTDPCEEKVCFKVNYVDVKKAESVLSRKARRLLFLLCL